LSRPRKKFPGHYLSGSGGEKKKGISAAGLQRPQKSAGHLPLPCHFNRKDTGPDPAFEKKKKKDQFAPTLKKKKKKGKGPRVVKRPRHKEERKTASA